MNLCINYWRSWESGTADHNQPDRLSLPGCVYGTQLWLWRRLSLWLQRKRIQVTTIKFNPCQRFHASNVTEWEGRSSGEWQRNMRWTGGGDLPGGPPVWCVHCKQEARVASWPTTTTPSQLHTHTPIQPLHLPLHTHSPYHLTHTPPLPPRPLHSTSNLYTH